MSKPLPHVQILIAGIHGAQLQRRALYIPNDPWEDCTIDVAVNLASGPHAHEYELRVKPRNNGSMVPTWPHDCPKCVYLGAVRIRGELFDWYRHPTAKGGDKDTAILAKGRTGMWSMRPSYLTPESIFRDVDNLHPALDAMQIVAAYMYAQKDTV